MMTDEAKVLIDSVKQFCNDEIDRISLNIERDGIPPELSKKLAAQGFYALLPGEKMGGAGISPQLYFRILSEFSVHSPSVALQVSMVNSLIMKLVEQVSSDVLEVHDIINAVSIPSVPMGSMPLIPDTISFSDHKVSCTAGIAASFGSDSLLLRNKDGRVILINEISGEQWEDRPLGFRGIRQFRISVSNKSFEEVGKLGDELYFDGEISAIAIGIARGAVSKAIEYSRVRNTFNHPLKDYGPVAFSLSELHSSIGILENFLYSDQERSPEDLLRAKIMAVSLAKQASRESVQVHGGYGYIEDFGVERYYRDSMMLSSVLSNRLEDLSRLATCTYSEKAGFL